MRPAQYSSESLSELLCTQKIATMPELLTALGTNAKRTVFRKLKELGYRTSYSHRGGYYALDQSIEFDELGLWSCEEVWFSLRGTLLSTAAAFVEASPCGYFVDELDNVLHVGTRDPLRKLVAKSGLKRSRLGGQFLYHSAEAKHGRNQILERRSMLAEPGVAGALPEAAFMPEELRASIVLFFSMLDEKTRRLYAGLEALKTGRGGDARIADLLGLSVGTVARGRRELLKQDVEAGRVRRAGAGRKTLEKKRRKSSMRSKNS
jgi:hypothetical protein